MNKYLNLCRGGYEISSGALRNKVEESSEQAAIARESADLREHFLERGAVLEHDGGMARDTASAEAARITATLARNRGYLWASLREAFREHPELLAQVPDVPGAVDALVLGVAGLHARRDGVVLRQGEFAGGHGARDAALTVASDP